MKEFTSNFIDVKINLYDGYISIHSRFQRESLAIVNIHVEAKPVTSFKYFRHQEYLSRIDHSFSEFYQLSNS